MKETYRLRRQTAGRAPLSPCHLAAPLIQAWSIQHKAILWQLPLVDDDVVVRKLPGPGFVAQVEATGDERWRYEKSGTPVLIHDRKVLAWASEHEADVVDIGTGALVGVLHCPLLPDPVAVEDFVLGVAREPGAGYSVCGARLSLGRVEWRVPIQPGNGKPGMPCASLDAGVMDLGDGTVLAVALTDGRVLWHVGVEDLAHEDPHHGSRAGRPVGVPTIWQDRVILRVWPAHVVALALGDGSRLWTWSHTGGAVEDGYLYGDRYYVNTGVGSYHVLDPASGSELLAADLRKSLPTKLGNVVPHGPMLVSETHVFIGTLEGHVIAFGRDSGRFAWDFRAQRGTGIGSYFVAANGRFYYTDMTFRLYCLEEREPTNPSRIDSRGIVRR